MRISRSRTRILYMTVFLLQRIPINGGGSNSRDIMTGQHIEKIRNQKRKNWESKFKKKFKAEMKPSFFSLKEFTAFFSLPASLAHALVT